MLLLHGLLLSSLRFVLNGPDGNAKSLAYQLADSGLYDVWLLNFRGNSYSRQHAYMDADSARDFWDFSFEEFGERDVPAAIKFILKESPGFRKVDLIGFSQGTTATMFGLSAQSKSSAYLHETVQSAVLLGPSMLLKDLSYSVLRQLANNKVLWKFLFETGLVEISGTRPAK